MAVVVLYLEWVMYTEIVAAETFAAETFAFEVEVELYAWQAVL